MKKLLLTLAFLSALSFAVAAEEKKCADQAGCPAKNEKACAENCDQACCAEKKAAGKTDKGCCEKDAAAQNAPAAKK